MSLDDELDDQVGDIPDSQTETVSPVAPEVADDRTETSDPTVPDEEPTQVEGPSVPDTESSVDPEDS